MARTNRAPIRTFVTAASLVAGAAVAFGAGIYVQRFGSASASPDSRSFQLAQAGQEHGGSAFAGSHRRRGASTRPENDADSPAATLETVYSLVREHYVDALPNDGAMSHGAVRSLLSALHDPNVFFLDRNQRALVENEARGKYAGIGAALIVRPVATNGYTEHKIEVVSALPGSPAEKAGLRPHDIVTRIDGKWVLGSDPFLKVDNLVARLQAQKLDSDTDEVERETTEARRLAGSGIGLVRAQMALRGDQSILDVYHLPKDILKLTVISPSSPASRVVEIQPGETDVALPQVTSGTEGLTVIRVQAFTDSTFNTVKSALDAAPAASGGVVLDLRGNSGGVGNGPTAMQAAQKIAGLLCPSGLGPASEFAVERLAGNRVETLRLAATGETKDNACSLAPILVLVDSGTAAAAEALAAALADAGRARIIGRRTFGCAGVESLYDLPDGSGFLLSTAQLSSPKHVEWAGRGLTPSIVLPEGASEAQIMARAAALLTGSGAENARIAADAPRLH